MRAADDAAEHVAAAFVRGHHAVDDEEGAGADVIRDHAQRAGGEVLRARELRRGA